MVEVVIFPWFMIDHFYREHNTICCHDIELPYTFISQSLTSTNLSLLLKCCPSTSDNDSWHFQRYKKWSVHKLQTTAYEFVANEHFQTILQLNCSWLSERCSGITSKIGNSSQNLCPCRANIVTFLKWLGDACERILTKFGWSKTYFPCQ